MRTLILYIKKIYNKNKFIMYKIKIILIYKINTTLIIIIDNLNRQIDVFTLKQIYLTLSNIYNREKMHDLIYNAHGSRNVIGFVLDNHHLTCAYANLFARLVFDYNQYGTKVACPQENLSIAFKQRGHTAGSFIDRVQNPIIFNREE